MEVVLPVPQAILKKAPDLPQRRIGRIYFPMKLMHHHIPTMTVVPLVVLGVVEEVRSQTRLLPRSDGLVVLRTTLRTAIVTEKGIGTVVAKRIFSEAVAEGTIVEIGFGTAIVSAVAGATMTAGKSLARKSESHPVAEEVPVIAMRTGSGTEGIGTFRRTVPELVVAMRVRVDCDRRLRWAVPCHHRLLRLLEGQAKSADGAAEVVAARIGTAGTGSALGIEEAGIVSASIARAAAIPSRANVVGPVMNQITDTAMAAAVAAVG